MSEKENAIVTGGATGIGNAIAHKLASRGMNVLVADINVPVGEEVVEHLKSRYGVDAVFVKTDICKEEDVINMVQTAVKRWGKISYAVNNAGAADVMKPHEEDYTVDQFDKMYALNARGTWMCQRHICLQMCKQEPRQITLVPSDVVIQERGSVVNISSVNGLIGNGLPGYSAAKAGVQSITRTGAQFYGPHSIRVNAISPGSIWTEAMKAWIKTLPQEQATFVTEGITAQTPLKRRGNPEELANTWMGDGQQFDTEAMSRSDLREDSSGWVSMAQECA